MDESNDQPLIVPGLLPASNWSLVCFLMQLFVKVLFSEDNHVSLVDASGGR